MKTTSYQIGVSEYDMHELSTFDCPPPTVASFNKYPTVYSIQTGRTVGDGLPTVEWQWDIMPARAWHELLETYLQGQQCRAVYIITMDPSGWPETYSQYTALMHRPEVTKDGTRVMGGFYSNVKIRFTRVEAV